ncbi:MAG: DUF58 domain-containing protein [Sphingobacteriales bacterium]|nr:MAG: DUF58 domain-containing protein [Sphingobacteriales bacterium]
MAQATLLHPGALQNLELLARQVVEGFIIGLHRSPFHGFSAEFAEHRLYNAGEPLRHVDWKVFGRTDRLFSKRYEEETNLRCCIAIDTSASMAFPETGPQVSKYQFSLVAAAAMLQLLKRQLDATSLAFFDAGLQTLTDARSAPRHYQQLTAQLEARLQMPPEARHTSIAAALHELAERLPRRMLVMVFTDTLEGNSNLGAVQDALQHLRFNKHEVIVFQVLDRKREQEFLFENRPYEFEDPETGAKVRVQPAQVREAYLSGMSGYLDAFRNYCLQNRIDLAEADIAEPVEAVLRTFLSRRSVLA